jgi:hypothetical protein
MTTSLPVVGISPPAQLAATSQKPDDADVQVLEMLPVAKLSAFENVVAVAVSPLVSMLAKLPVRQPSVEQERTV